MLLKVYVEDTLPFLRGSKGNVLITWIVNETLPLSHPQQLAAFANALNLSQEEREQIDVKTFSLVHGSQAVDTSLTPVEAMLVSGTVLTMAARSNTPRTMRQMSAIATPRGGQDSPRSASVVRSPKSSYRFKEEANTSAFSHGDDASESRYAETNASPSEYPDGDETMSMQGDINDEVYVSEECGWFPFHVSSNYGQLAVATCIDPSQTAKETDRNPPIQQMCPACSKLLGDCQSLGIPVDRHYKPMSLNYEVSEGWVEKLSLGRFSRWQKRYLMMSERSVDWFQMQPSTGDKAKILGMRHVMRDGVINILDIIENPDPATYPKCKDTNYFHFGVVFKHPSTAMFFRVPSLQQRVKYVTFLKQMVTRLGNTGAQKDPVYWKKWSDALLTNLADLGEVATTNRFEAAELERELASIHLRRHEIREEMPGLRQVLERQRESVQALKKEIANVDSMCEAAERDAKTAEENIELEEIQLGIAEIEVGDELRKAEVLSVYARNQKSDASKRIETLTFSIEELKEKHACLFAKWRKLEEHSHTKHVGLTSPTAKVSPAQLLSFSPSGVPLSQSVKSLPRSWQTPSPARK